jgi:hypothetical protein
MKVCNVTDDKVTVLVVSIGSKEEEVFLPKFAFHIPPSPQPPRIADRESKLTYVKLTENGPNMLECGKWFIIQGERTLASGEIHFGKDVARQIMLSAEPIAQLTKLLKSKAMDQ